MDQLRRVLPDTAGTVDGRLTVGGCDAAGLAERHGTPLMLLDRATFEVRARSYAEGLGDPSRVWYAGKAFLCVAVCELVDELGLGLDVCSGGELATATAAGFPPERIEFHGNNKSLEELESAAAAGIGRVVIDSFPEMKRIAKAGLSASTMVRVTPGVEAHTHEFIQTGQEDSKFGFTLADDVALRAIEEAMSLPGCELAGLHAHIGSQIFELTAFDLAVERLAGLLVQARDRLGFVARELNLGGGFGIAHSADEASVVPVDIVAAIRAAVERRFAEARLPVPGLSLEPGRSIVGPAGVTLYTVGTVKTIPDVRSYVSVDGGMSDNIHS